MLEHRLAGDRLREGDAHRWLSRLAWFSGDGANAEDEARLAIELLVPLGPGRELAMAYSNLAQLRMLTSDEPGSIEWGMHAVALAEELGEAEILAHALNNVGTSEMRVGIATGRGKLERSLALALDHDLEEHVARAYTNLGSTFLDLSQFALADEHLAAGIDYCRDRDLDAWLIYMTGHQARSYLNQGRWDEAGASAMDVLTSTREAPPSRIWPLLVVGILRARRGDADPWTPLDEALELARGIGELQRLSPVAAARAEAHWLAGETEAIEEETALTLELAIERRDLCAAGEMYMWRRRAGMVEPFAPKTVSEVYRLELEGEHEAAADLWRELGYPFEAALALAHARLGGRTASGARRAAAVRCAPRDDPRRAHAAGGWRARCPPRPAHCNT